MKKLQENEKYQDIIDLPHPVSSKRARMSNYDRAAQFSPFAALTGYDGVIQETGRLTRAKIELSEDGKALLDEKLRYLRRNLGACPRVKLTCFQPDQRKLGGEYVTVAGNLLKIDEYKNTLVLQGGRTIPIDSIFEIECDLEQDVQR